jgi:hypothetical protein
MVINLTKMYWLPGRRSQLSLRNKLLLYKLLLYKTIVKPIWTYGIQLWGNTSTSKIERRTLVCAEHSHPSRPLTSVKEEISRISSQYSSRLTAHPNNLLPILIEPPELTRLRRNLPQDLPTRFIIP